MQVSGERMPKPRAKNGNVPKTKTHTHAHIEGSRNVVKGKGFRRARNKGPHQQEGEYEGSEPERSVAPQIGGQPRCWDPTGL